MTRSFKIEELKGEYQALWDSMEITRTAQINESARRVIAGRTFYEELERSTGVPWYFIGCLHLRESSCNFRTHLHNGDSLLRRTRHVPSGRPKFPPTGTNGYTWIESAQDALAIKNLDQQIDWTIPRMLYEAERYNGWGYRYSSRRPRSPYLWAGSNHYTKGKFVSDGRYSSSTVDTQPGVAPVLKRIMEITGATKVPGSRSAWWTKFYKWVLPGGGGLTALLQQFTDFLSSWETVVAILAVAGAAAVGFYVVEQYRLREYKEGRLVPSDEENLDELA